MNFIFIACIGGSSTESTIFIGIGLQVNTLLYVYDVYINKTTVLLLYCCYHHHHHHLYLLKVTQSNNNMQIQ